MGVPVVSIEGASHVGRVGLSILSAIGHPELVAKDEDAYVATAVALATDFNRRKALRCSLRDQLAKSPLCDAGRLVDELECAYREAWRSCCEAVDGRKS